MAYSSQCYCLQALLLLASITSIISLEICSSPFPPVGIQADFPTDFVSCSHQVGEMHVPTIEFCRERCFRFSGDCRSFEFECDETSIYNCKLFDMSFEKLLWIANQGTADCLQYKAPDKCVHEDVVQQNSTDIIKKCLPSNAG